MAQGKVCDNCWHKNPIDAQVCEQCGGVFKTETKPVEPAVAKSSEVRTFDGPGKGRKQCAKCQRYIGAKTDACVCGSTDFAKKVYEPKSPKLKTSTEPKPIKTFDAGGRGLKECAKCHKFIGSILRTCACGSTEFIRKTPDVQEPKPIKTFDAGGRGLKECAKCHKFLGNVVKTCACGSTEFIRKTPIVKEKEVKVYDRPGPCRKQCEQCKQYVDRQCRQCVCGHAFDMSDIPELPENKKPVKNQDRWELPAMIDVEGARYAKLCGCGCRVIIGPAGVCPKLTHTDEASVHNWAAKTLDSGHVESLHYSPAALRYYLATQFDRRSEEYKETLRHLDNWLEMSTCPPEDDYDTEEPEDEELDEEEDYVTP
jgi:hypothetical protein